jgi:hypothetical protein
MDPSTSSDPLDRRSIHRRRLLGAVVGLGASAAALLAVTGASADETGENATGDDATSVTTGGTNTGTSQHNGPVKGKKRKVRVRGPVVVGEDGADG